MEVKDTLSRALLASFVRKMITWISGILLGYGLVNAELADRLNTEAVGLITTALLTFLVSAWLSYKNVIIERLKTIVGIAVPPNTTVETVSAIAQSIPNKSEVAKAEVPIEIPKV